MNLVFLYTRLPGYFLACLEQLALRETTVRIHCIAYRPSAESPYIHTSNISIKYKDDLRYEGCKDLVGSLNPSLIYVAGWSDNDYNRIAKGYTGTIPVIVGMDNPWKGTIRQRLAVILYSRRLRKLFNYIWVPGIRQYEFAKRLGFLNSKILRGLYCAMIGPSVNAERSSYSNKTLLFVGRLVEYKKPDWIVQAFLDFYQNGKYLDWKVVILGSGPLHDKLVYLASRHPQIQIINFVQPADTIQFYEQASIFCLPSHNEHWGVVVHEAAIAGRPLLVSDSCGSIDEFLLPGYNGYSFISNDFQSFKSRLKDLLEKDESQLYHMGQKSRILARRVDYEYWSAQLLSTIKTNR